MYPLQFRIRTDQSDRRQRFTVHARRIGDEGADRNVDDDIVQREAVLAREPQRRALCRAGNFGGGLVRLADTIL